MTDSRTLLRSARRTQPLDDAQNGVAPPSETGELLAANTWWAARHGLEATLCDPRDGRQRSAEAVVALLDRTERALSAAAGLEAVRSAVGRLLRLGSPAHRQRAAYRRGGVRGVLELITGDW
ncbi:gamma-glutamyl:cysteine ligase YbdK (ATP-grasp superfamily) [Streptacidiphilus sp. MAP12-33]|uniref:hypothetical protein n=1 Tax=Streptacidiphilus sp. MAP12-33 TaxID=3156266 RepID=UPI00351623E4